jgi:hypothetical protein
MAPARACSRARPGIALSTESLIDESLLAEAPESLLGPVPPAAARADLFRLRERVQPVVSRYLFATLVLTGLLGIGIVLQSSGNLPGLHRGLLLAAFGGLAIGSLACLRIGARGIEPALAAMVTLAVVAIALAALLIGGGLAAPGLALFGLLACLICALARRRVALPVVGVMLAALLAIHFVPAAAGLPVAPSAVGATTRLAVHLLVLTTGLVGGLMISGVVARHMRSPPRTASTASAACWASPPTPTGRSTSATAWWPPRRSATAHFGLGNGDGLGMVPWDLPQFGCDDETLDLLQADLDTRAPFRNLAMHWRSASGTVRHLVVSGEPRFDERGVFSGYWGVARDVTAELQARQAWRPPRPATRSCSRASPRRW